MDQHKLLSQIKDKCDLISHLYAGSRDWIFDKNRNSFNDVMIDDLVKAVEDMMVLLRDEYIYLEAANYFEKVLTRLNRNHEVNRLYHYADDRFDC